MPVPGGNTSMSFLHASRPPAEAPMPTTGNSPATRGTCAVLETRAERDRAILARCGGLADIWHPFCERAGAYARLAPGAPIGFQAFGGLAWSASQNAALILIKVTKELFKARIGPRPT